MVGLEFTNSFQLPGEWRRTWHFAGCASLIRPTKNFLARFEAGRTGEAHPAVSPHILAQETDPRRYMSLNAKPANTDVSSQHYSLDIVCHSAKITEEASSTAAISKL